MNKTNFFFEAAQAGIVLSAVVALTLIGCGGNADTSREAGPAPSPTTVQVQSPSIVDEQSPTIVQAGSPINVAPDDYVYYPSYGIYYGSGRHQYASLQSGAWVSQPAPRGVSVGELQASPSVKMDFHDAPANHHAATVQKYPTTWKPSASK